MDWRHEERQRDLLLAAYFERRVRRTTRERWAGLLRVREARDPRTTVERLRMLARDELRPVRLWVARNPHTPVDALERLALDYDAAVGRAAFLHPQAPESALRYHCDRERHRSRSFALPTYALRSAAMVHPHAGPALIAQLKAEGVKPELREGTIRVRRVSEGSRLRNAYYVLQVVGGYDSEIRKVPNWRLVSILRPKIGAAEAWALVRAADRLWAAGSEEYVDRY